jgi:sugar lactone lactonase YvrE
MKLRLAGGILAAHLVLFGTPISSISGADAVYIVDNSASPHIDEYTTAGVFVRTLVGGPANVLFWNGLAFGADGYLYATDTFNCISGNCDNEPEQFDTNMGAYLGAVGSINANATSLNGLALGPDGNLYVTTNQLGLYRIDPVANTTIPIPTAGCCTFGVAFMPNGTPLSVDASSNAVRNDLTGAAFTRASLPALAQLHSVPTADFMFWNTIKLTRFRALVAPSRR